MGNKRKTFDIGRDAETGKFVTVEEAKKDPKGTTIERIPKAGRGDTKGEPKQE